LKKIIIEEEQEVIACLNSKLKTIQPLVLLLNLVHNAAKILFKHSRIEGWNKKFSRLPRLRIEETNLGEGTYAMQWLAGHALHNFQTLTTRQEI
jgi:hypothetical protein